MSIVTPPSDAPFGLEPNVAAGLAYLLTIVGGIVMLAGGGTNKFVKWSAAQSITLWGAYVVLQIALGLLGAMVHLLGLLDLVVGLLWFGLWIWTFVTAFQGREVRVPVIDGITESIFKAAL